MIVHTISNNSHTCNYLVLVGIGKRQGSDDLENNMTYTTRSFIELGLNNIPSFFSRKIYAVGMRNWFSIIHRHISWKTEGQFHFERSF